MDIFTVQRFEVKMAYLPDVSDVGRIVLKLLQMPGKSQFASRSGLSVPWSIMLSPFARHIKTRQRCSSGNRAFLGTP